MATPVASNVTRLRRSRCLIGSWRDGRFVLENYLTGGQVVSFPIVAQLIHEFSEPTQVSIIEKILNESVPGGNLFSQLLEADILVDADSELASQEDAIDKWPWGHDARYFHFATKRVSYTFDFDAIREHFEKLAEVSPPPSPFKEYEETRGRILLPSSNPQSMARFCDVLEARRTVRAFRRNPISLALLGQLLKQVWGKQRFYNSSKLDARILKTSPSGGARHPIEVYVGALRVEGVTPGLYHYSVKHHALTLLSEGIQEDRMVELFSGQYWVRDAAALFFMTAVLTRSMWKYDHSRAYRVIQLDAGHLGQTFHLACTALGLGPFTTAAIQDADIESELGIDGVLEVSIYAGATGYSSGEC